MGFRLVATAGTHRFLRAAGLPCERINKVREGRPHVVDAIKNGQLDLIINTPSGKSPRKDEVSIRATAVAERVPLVTTVWAAESVVTAVAALRGRPLGVRTVQEFGADVPYELPPPPRRRQKIAP
jgi:carbamoyl-phosphate synthase large subunit